MRADESVDPPVTIEPFRMLHLFHLLRRHVEQLLIPLQHLLYLVFGHITAQYIGSPARRQGFE